MAALSRRSLLRCAALSGGWVAAGCVPEASRPVVGLDAEALDAVGGQPMSLSQVAAAAKAYGGGEPIAILDLAAIDHNCEVLLQWSRDTGMAWRPAYKTLQAAGLLDYVVRKLEQPKVMIHHLRNLPDALKVLPAETDYLMGYPPTTGELQAYLQGAYLPLGLERLLQINIDSLALLEVLLAELNATTQRAYCRVVFELDSGGPRGGLSLAELDAAVTAIKPFAGQVSVSGLLCYDVLAAAAANGVVRYAAAEYAQRQLREGRDLILEKAAGQVDAGGLVTNGPGSANYRNWRDRDAANELSAGSAVLFADYLDDYDDGTLRKAMYLCAPVLRLPRRIVAGLPIDPALVNMQMVFIKAGGWPTGNNPTLSRLVYPEGLREAPPYGRGANSSGMIFAPPGALQLDDYVITTAAQLMEGQNYFGALHAVREGVLTARWASVPRWGSV